MNLSNLKQIMLLFTIVFALWGCDYSRDPFPTEIVSDYELAIPIVDTVVNFAEIAFPLDYLPNENQEILSGIIGPEKISFPFYLADFFEDGQYLSWIEPKIIIDSDFLDKIDFMLDFFLEDESGGILHILNSNIKLTSGENVLFGNADSRLDFNSNMFLKDAKKITVQATIVVKESITVKDLVNSKSNIKIGLKVGINMGFTRK